MDNRKIGFGGFFEDYGDQLISSGIQAGSQYASSQAQQSRAASAQGKQIGAQFDNLVSQAKALFLSIDARLPNITADDYNAALGAYQVIENFASQYPIEYVTTQWNSSAYKQAAQNYLAKFQAVLSSPSSVALVGVQSTALTIGTQQSAIGNLSPWAIAAIAILLVLVIKK